MFYPIFFDPTFFSCEATHYFTLVRTCGPVSFLKHNSAVRINSDLMGIKGKDDLHLVQIN